MKVPPIVLGLLLIAGTAFAVSEVTQNKAYSWRYKMTVEVETPEGIKTGSTVREVRVTFKPRPGHYPSGYLAKHKMKGEAVVVDLGERGVLFGTITADSYPEVTETFPGPPAFTFDGAKYYSTLKDKSAPLVRRRYPTFLTFGDLKDPASVRMVLGNVYDDEQKQYVPVGNFEKHFGEGVKLKGITIEITNEPIEWKARQFLPWLNDYYDKQLDGSRGNYLGAENPIANRFSAGAFAPKLSEEDKDE